MADDGGPESAGEEQGRGRSGRFAPGRSGNPKGRPAGRRNRACEALDDLAAGRSTKILEALLKKAEAGDASAAEIVLRRAWPVPRGRHVRLPLASIQSAADAASAANAIVQAASAGAITPEDAGGLLALVETAARIAALADLEGRIESLETRAEALQP